MNLDIKSKYHSPIIGKIIILDLYIDKVGILPTKRILHTKIQKLDQKIDILYELAFRQLEGLDYLKRIVELIKSILALTFRIYILHGWSYKVACKIDAMCDEILTELLSLKTL